MDGILNITYITLDGYVDVDKYRYLYFVIMFMSFILIICFNSTIVWIIAIHKNLHEPMYIFIAALLINSALFSIVIYPKLLINILSEKQVITYQACLIQWFVNYSFAGSEYFLLSAMSYDRYVSICKPLQYPMIMRKTTVSMLLVLCWLLPACVIILPVVMSTNTKVCIFALKGISCNSFVFKLQCVTSQLVHIYGLLGGIVIIICPVLFILFTYIRIFVITYQSCREVRKKAAQTCLPHLLVLFHFSSLSAFDVLLARTEVKFPELVRLIIALQTILFHPLFNPVIYGLKMKEIYKHIKSLFSKKV
ncbi:olfactory receptor 6N2-like [Mugil cephalus]|uniref:olfactory receptor 6N2-like n=1 Tax=Mugil cephalus TaxID=48193 RepID=UPI001FB7F636|nr:olfactory receptor 6N2-like [Mugil cephalus]